MSDVMIRNVPDEAVSMLKARAAVRGQSPQAYLLAWVTDFASKPTLAELSEQVRARKSTNPGAYPSGPYAALAEAYEIPLVTTDAKAGRYGRYVNCTIEVL